jgi:hypothetical protein
MSAAIPCVPCCTTTQVVNVPGLQGAPGTNGINGVNAYAMTTADFTTPSSDGANVSVSLTNTLWMVVGMVVIIGQGGGAALPVGHTGPATFRVVSLPSSISATLSFLHRTGDVGNNILIGNGSGGALCSAGST